MEPDELTLPCPRTSKGPQTAETLLENNELVTDPPRNQDHLQSSYSEEPSPGTDKLIYGTKPRDQEEAQAYVEMIFTPPLDHGPVGIAWTSQQMVWAHWLSIRKTMKREPYLILDTKSLQTSGRKDYDILECDIGEVKSSGFLNPSFRLEEHQNHPEGL